MYLIVGLGNPEPEYSYTRHNMGFDVINKIAKKCEIDISRTKFNGLYGSGIIKDEKVILLKPQTYMNLSGEAVRDFKNFYKIDENKLIVIYDDLDVEPGKIKIRKKGSAGTHNGMKSVVEQISTQNFYRIRIGIGQPEFKGDLLNYILTKIPEAEYNILKKPINNAAEAVIDIIKNGVDHTMNMYN